TPGIYILHALTIALFGEHMWAIRIAELGGVVMLGLLAAALTYDARRGERPLPGMRGAAIFSASFLYFGFADFWNTAQSEFWYALLGIASAWAVSRIRRDVLAYLLGGVFAASALIMKPPSVCFVAVAVGLLLQREFEAVRGGPDPMGRVSWWNRPRRVA